LAIQVKYILNSDVSCKADLLVRESKV